MISVIIAYYKNISALNLILQGLSKQTFKAFEVIVAEDDNNLETNNFLKKVETQFSFDIIHINQEKNDGFRKNIMLNKGIAVAKGDKIVFLDGDCIPHSKWLFVYAKNLKDNNVLFGRRVMLSPKLTERLSITKDIKHLNFFKLLLSKSKNLRYAFYFPFFKPIKPHGIWGCNWGVYKKHLVELNGYDENYTKPGIGEDVDIEWRLKRKGVTLQSVRNSAIVFHMHHDSHYTDEIVKENLEYLKSKDLSKELYCINGLDKSIKEQNISTSAV